MPRLLILLILCAVLPACGGKGDRSATTPVPRTPDRSVIRFEHCEPYQTPTLTSALPERGDLWIRIPDANRIIYDYATSSTPATDAEAVRTAVRTLTTVQTTPARDQVQIVQVPDSANKAAEMERAEFVEYAMAVMEAGQTLWDAVRLSDEQACDSSSVSARWKLVHEKRDEAVRPGVLTVEHLRTAHVMSYMLDSLLHRALENATAEQVTLLAALHTRAREVVPSVALLWGQLQSSPFGEVSILHKHERGDRLVELAIRNRLGEAYVPRQVVPEEPVRIGIVRERPPALLFSGGLSALFGDRRTYSLVEVDTLPGTFRVSEEINEGASFAPTAWLTMQQPFHTTATIGASLGVGLSGDLREINRTTDLLLGLTLGYHGIYVTGGQAYTSEVTGLGELDDNGHTTDPNILNRATRERVWRWYVGLHLRP